MKVEVGALFRRVDADCRQLALVNVLGSRSSTGAKVLWAVLVLLLPLLGFIIWLIVGPRAPKTA
jgi:Phospholipase_D-nuclease N-terminal